MPIFRSTWNSGGFVRGRPRCESGSWFSSRRTRRSPSNRSGVRRQALLNVQFLELQKLVARKSVDRRERTGFMLPEKREGTSEHRAATVGERRPVLRREARN